MRAAALAAVSLWLLACAARDTPHAVDEARAHPPAQRIVTLAPHLTELVYTAGAGDRLVGVVAWSDYPPAARELPQIGDAFRVDLERLAQLRPDLVLGWETGNPAEVIAQLERHGYRVVTLATPGLDAVADNLVAIGELAGTTDIAGVAAADYRRSLSALRTQYAEARAVSVFYQISPQPLYTVGGPHPITQMIETCGGRNIFDDIDAMAPVVSIEDVVLRDPDAIVAGPPPGGDDTLDNWRRWPQLAAVRHARLYAVDPSLVTRASTRLLDGLRQLCQALEHARSQPDAQRPPDE